MRKTNIHTHEYNVNIRHSYITLNWKKKKLYACMHNINVCDWIRLISGFKMNLLILLTYLKIFLDIYI